MNAEPFFSIVIPVFNREREILRAVDSCLEQSFSSYEIVVVDDDSTDGTAVAVETRSDSRVRLVRHSANRGECPARNTGVRASAGKWIVFLDSDDELRPDCLARVFEATTSAEPDLGRFGFMYDLDDGRVSPYPLPSCTILDYVAWLRWIDVATGSDALWVTRRRCFEICMMPDTFAPPLSYHLSFAKAFRSKIIPEHLAIVHTTATHRLSSLSPSADSRRERRLLDQIDDLALLLANHGDALSTYAPRLYSAAMRRHAALSILAGERPRGVACAIALVRSHPWALKNWALLLFVLLGRSPIGWVIAFKHRLERHHAAGSETPSRVA
jgi:glycosyltransferase involved in cell wall biosynthesis